MYWAHQHISHISSNLRLLCACKHTLSESKLQNMFPSTAALLTRLARLKRVFAQQTCPVFHIQTQPSPPGGNKHFYSNGSHMPAVGQTQCQTQWCFCVQSPEPVAPFDMTPTLSWSLDWESLVLRGWQKTSSETLNRGCGYDWIHSHRVAHCPAGPGRLEKLVHNESLSRCEQ